MILNPVIALGLVLVLFLVLAFFPVDILSARLQFSMGT